MSWGFYEDQTQEAYDEWIVFQNSYISRYHVDVYDKNNLKEFAETMFACREDVANYLIEYIRDRIEHDVNTGVLLGLIIKAAGLGESPVSEILSDTDLPAVLFSKFPLGLIQLATDFIKDIRESYKLDILKGGYDISEELEALNTTARILSLKVEEQAEEKSQSQ